MVALIEESRHKVTEDTGRAFRDQVKQAQEWAWGHVYSYVVMPYDS